MVFLWPIYLYKIIGSHVEVIDLCDDSGASNPEIDDLYVSVTNQFLQDCADKSTEENPADMSSNISICDNKDTNAVSECDRLASTNKLNEWAYMPLDTFKPIYACYSKYYINSMKLRISIQRQEYDENDNYESMIHELLNLKYIASEKTLEYMLLDCPANLQAFFKTKKNYWNGTDLPDEDVQYIRFKNTQVLEKIIDYANRIDFEHGLGKIFQSFFDFLLDELMAVLRTDSILYFESFFKPSRSNCNDNIEFMLTIYAYVYLDNILLNQNTTDSEVKGFIGNLIQAYNANPVLHCQDCNNPRSTHTLIEQSTISHFIYCENHKEHACVQAIMTKHGLAASPRFTVEDYLNRIEYLNTVASKNGIALSEIDQAKSIIKYKKLADFSRFLINHRGERYEILKRMQKVIFNLPGYKFETKMFLEAVLEFELQHTAKFDNVTDSVFDNFLKSKNSNGNFVYNNTDLAKTPQKKKKLTLWMT